MPTLYLNTLCIHVCTCMYVKALILLNKNTWKEQRFQCAKRRRCSEIAKGDFSKITETADLHVTSSMEAAYSEYWIAIHSISMVGYCNRHTSFLSAANSQPGSFNRWAISLILENWPLVISPNFAPFDSSKPFILCA